MIEIVHRFSRAVLYRSEDATTIREAMVAAVVARAYLAGADLAGAILTGAGLAGADLARATLVGATLAGADLAGATLAGADLAGATLARADLAGAYLAGADLAGANLVGAYLAGADLAGVNLVGAYLAGATLAGANLVGAEGVNKYLTTPLYGLLDQPGPIRAYKLVTAAGIGPFNGGLTYVVGATVTVADANTNEVTDCGAGINLATLDWCCRQWRPGYRILVAEFTAAEVAAVPVGSDGKFRVHACRIVGEKDVVALGLGAPAVAGTEAG